MNDETPRGDDSIWLATLTAEERRELKGTGGDSAYPMPDVLVVGGGIVGLSIAYFLCEQGARVQVIEARSLASGASGASAGGIWPNDQGPNHAPAFQSIAFLSRDLWGRLSLRPQFQLDWRVNGLLNLNVERMGPAPGDAATRLQEQGYALQEVDGEQISRLEPALRPGLDYGWHMPSEAHLHPVRAALSLARGARSRGVHISTGVTAKSIERRNGKVTIVQTNAGPIEAKQVVAATGWTADWLTEALDPLPPLRPVSGQLICTPPVPSLLRGTVAGRFLVFQLRSGEIVTGPDVEESDRLLPDARLTAQFADAARELIPALREVPFDRAWRGIRPATPDGLPVIDRAARVENLWLALGHFRNGVLLAPGTGRLLADWIIKGNRPEELAPFGIARFADEHWAR